jgi:hypothetical protein
MPAFRLFFLTSQVDPLVAEQNQSGKATKPMNSAVRETTTYVLSYMLMLLLQHISLGVIS